MANVDNPYGFRPWGPVLATKNFAKDSSAGVTYKNDLVMMEADGNIAPLATVGSNTIYCVGSTVHNSAVSTAENVLVYSDPDQKMEAQDDGSGAPAATDIGGNMDAVVGSGSTYTKISGHELDYSSFHATNTGLGFRLLDLVNRPSNTWADNADLVVAFNEHFLRFQSSGGRGGI